MDKDNINRFSSLSCSNKTKCSCKRNISPLKKCYHYLFIDSFRKSYLYRVLSLIIGFPILSLILAIINACFTDKYINNRDDILKSMNHAIIWSFVIMSVIYLLIYIPYTKIMLDKSKNKSLFNLSMIKFIFQSVIAMVSVFSISIGFINKLLLNLISSKKYIRLIMYKEISDSLMIVFLIPAIAFAALIIVTACYEKILVKKRKF